MEIDRDLLLIIYFTGIANGAFLWGWFLDIYDSNYRTNKKKDERK